VLDFKKLLQEVKEEPYEEIVVRAPHTGTVKFVVGETGTKVNGVSGTWKEVPGTLLANLEREKNKKPLHAPQKGEVVEFFDVRDGDFVEAGTPLLKIRHFLTKDEVIQIILQKALFLFPAPEKGKYYFVPDIDAKIKSKGCRSVRVHPGEEVFILSRMKRETQVRYQGPAGLIYTVYFQSNESVDREAPLIGVCPEDQLGHIEEVVSRIQSEWEEVE
jgi:hypothetical protein